MLIRTKKFNYFVLDNIGYVAMYGIIYVKNTLYFNIGGYGANVNACIPTHKFVRMNAVVGPYKN